MPPAARHCPPPPNKSNLATALCWYSTKTFLGLSNACLGKEEGVLGDDVK